MHLRCSNHGRFFLFLQAAACFNLSPPEPLSLSRRSGHARAARDGHLAFFISFPPNLGVDFPPFSHDVAFSLNPFLTLLKPPFFLPAGRPAAGFYPFKRQSPPSDLLSLTVQACATCILTLMIMPSTFLSSQSILPSQAHGPSVIIRPRVTRFPVFTNYIYLTTILFCFSISRNEMSDTPREELVLRLPPFSSKSPFFRFLAFHFKVSSTRDSQILSPLQD